MTSPLGWFGVGALFASALFVCVAPTPGAARDAVSASAAAGDEQPSQVVENAAHGFLQELDAHRAEYRKDPALLRQAVDRDVLPHFDIQYAARLVLGRYWRTATPAQQQRFINAFEGSLFNNYGSALLEFRADRLQVYPTHVSAGARDAFVRTVIRRDDGSKVEVDYALRMTPQGWKAWDVIIEGISYVKSFRDDFGAQIEQQGLDAVIERLEHGEKPAALGATTGRSS
ncbi:MAG TPA: ABC transporter substrate-binding protein [Steroidobacteraceae bacterium]|nr:ABC transporter substrate-binding protein [Steroidobacteraceae bacterium]